MEFMKVHLTNRDSNIDGALFNKKYADELCEENQLTWSPQQKYSNLLHLYDQSTKDIMPIQFQMNLLK
jgi:hypothetical protein